MKRLYRSRERIIAGICGGIAEYLNIDPVVVRLVAAVSILFSFFTVIIAYFIAWMIIPERP
ncbi:MAG TPA: PspC domain-containing protein [Bacillota bacterium]|mgnify:CR=1 FL=1|nr:PspC domain-containing protein [Bacillota bacterium]HPT86460.1 PspC domain-containing protein [Bacillota bacterium]